MFFRHVCEALELGHNLIETPDVFLQFESPLKALVHVAKTYPNRDKPAERSSAISIGTTEADVPADCGLSEAVSAVDWKKLPEREGITRNEQMTQIWAVVDRVFNPLMNLTETSVAILRWRAGLTKGPADFIRNRKQSLSTDGERWLDSNMVRGFTIRQIPEARQVVGSAELSGDVVEYVESATEEPLGHQLFREAWSLRSEHPRSALVIGVAAAEVGLKKLAGALVPGAMWLLEEIQSPPLDKMLRKYLPLLPVKLRFTGKKIAPPSTLVNLFKEAVEQRNKVVHAGKLAPDPEKLEEMLEAIDDFLWICDAYSGCAWVGGFISQSTLTKWEAEPMKPAG